MFASEETDVLLTIAEVAATFAGFVALVTLFARRRVAAAAVHDLLRLRLVIGASVVEDDFPADRLAVGVVLVLEIFVQIGLILIVFGVAEQRHYGLYVSALIGTIGQAAFVLLRLVESTFSTIVVRPDVVRPEPRDFPP